MNKYEQPSWSKKQLVAGIDEAGRGPLAGPLVVASVILPIGYKHQEIRDSKELKEDVLRKLFIDILNDSQEINVEIVNVKTIDSDNIYRATQKAMTNLVNKSQADLVLVDAMPLVTDKNVKSIIKGDQKSISIAAASIIAKVIRDDIMIAYDNYYPEYGFKSHKGYGTKAHLEALENHGILEIHRKSFKPIYERQQLSFEL